MVLRFGVEVKFDLIIIDGVLGGIGMSLWLMMNEWGILIFYLEVLVYQFVEKFIKKGFRVFDFVIVGGFLIEDGVFKVIVMGVLYVKVVCMGRVLMILGMVGKNIEKWLKEGNFLKIVFKYGLIFEEIFIIYEELCEKYGDEIKNIFFGVIGIYMFV